MNYYLEFSNAMQKVLTEHAEAAYTTELNSFAYYYGQHLPRMVKYLNFKHSTMWTHSTLDAIINRVENLVATSPPPGYAGKSESELLAVINVGEKALEILHKLKNRV